MKIAVIGGGASGMMAAIAAAEEGASVFLYERNDRVGKKILSTGNGKCNFSNRTLTDYCYYGSEPQKRREVLEFFDSEQTVAFFRKAGMLIKDKEGYLYPASEQASTVLDILRIQLNEKGVHVLTERMVTAIERQKSRKGFLVHTDGESARYDKVILSCGGKAAPKTGSDGNGYRLAQSLGHSIIPAVPALVQLRCKEDWLKSVAGVRQDAEAVLYLNGKEVGRERGELQLTEYGISGILIFQLSRLASYGLLQKKRVTVDIDFLPDFTMSRYNEFVRERMQQKKSHKTVEEFFTGMLNKKLMLLFIRLAGLKVGDSCDEADSSKMEKVFALCRKLSLTVMATNSFEQAQVCAGGVPLKEVSSDLESLVAEGLFLTGELLDVDGKCGGYNLQWAWASGYLAGKRAAEKTGETV